MYKFAKLDLFMVKPYLKKMILILIAVSIPMVILTKNVYFLAVTSILYGMIMVSYPFILSEKNNIENFYGTLTINKKNIVNGRYIFALGMMIFFTVIACIATAIGIVAIKYDIDLNEVFFVLSLSVFIVLILLSIELPLYFKLGYTKGKSFIYIPLMVIALIPLIIKKLTSGSFAETLKSIGAYIENNTIEVSIIGVLCGLIIFGISNIISQKIYLNK